jgi:hypothetical protein
MGPLSVYIEPDALRLPQVDGPDEINATISVPCGACGFPNQLRAIDLISQSRSWLGTLDSGQIDRIKQAFDCSVHTASDFVHLSYSNEPAYCSNASCSSCSKQFIVCMQFYELQPMRYITKLVGAAIVAA